MAHEIKKHADRDGWLTLTFDFPAEFVVTRGHGNCHVDVARLFAHPHIMQNCVAEGIKTPIGDAASGSREAAGLPKDGALTEEQVALQGAKSTEQMNAKRDPLYEGIWRIKKQGESVDPIVVYMRRVVRDIFTKSALYPVESEAYKKARGEDKTVVVDAFIAENEGNEVGDWINDRAQVQMIRDAEEEAEKMEALAAIPSKLVKKNKKAA